MLKARSRIFLLVTFLLFAWACAGPYYFDLHLENSENPGSVKLNKVLLIEDVEINQTYLDQRIVYRESPFQVKYYSFMFWSKSPADLIEDAVVDFWRKSSIFKKVNAYGSAGDADLTMRIKIDAIEKYYCQNNWCARLAMDIEIEDSENKEIILTHAFDRKLKLKGNKVSDLPEKISEILHDELLKIEAKLQKDKS
ncbi:MAG: ABC-type transport auxiliary lipoprotein family protein [Candidatus Aminicenantes bacterium]|nr:ABC-type transport auxiliary lipoprotein family protein [Candidatus Aminicenantes bacterium]